MTALCAFFGHYYQLKLRRYDSLNFFHMPVRIEDVPDYYDIIKRPMDFSAMQWKLDNHKYTTVDDFEVSFGGLVTFLILI